MPIIKSYLGSYYGTNRQNTFSQVYETVEPFIADYQAAQLPQLLTEDKIATIYYLLFGKYANSTIASNDTARFKSRLFGIIYSYGPTWERNLKIQEDLRNLTDAEIKKGSVQIYNTAQNPQAEPTTDTTEPLPFINSQNTTHSKKGTLEAYTLYMSLLDDTVTEKFIDRFKVLFKTVASPELPLIYISED